jgi:peptide/nickel transport system permease protein
MMATARRHDGAKALLLRVFESFSVVVALASLTFFAFRLLPGDPARLVLGDDASPIALAQVRAELHLGESLGAQYVRFLLGLFSWDLGDSLRHPGVSAMALVAAALGPTARLACLAVGFGASLGLVAASLVTGPWLPPLGQKCVESGLSVAASIPLLALAPVATWLLAVRARLLPLPGDPDAGGWGLAFAAFLLAIPLAAHVGRVGCAALMDIAREPFLVVARAKGNRAARVWIVHALPVVAGPILVVVSSQLGALLGGAVVLERMFERWGLGMLILEAYQARDLPVIEGAVVAAGGIFVVVQTLGTAVHLALDPRAQSAR